MRFGQDHGPRRRTCAKRDSVTGSRPNCQVEFINIITGRCVVEENRMKGLIGVRHFLVQVVSRKARGIGEVEGHVEVLGTGKNGVSAGRFMFADPMNR